MADFSRVDQIIHRLRRFFQRNIRIESVHVVQVNIIALKADEGAVNLAQDVGAAAALVVVGGTNLHPDFGGDHCLLTFPFQALPKISSPTPPAEPG